jgi:lipoprotein-releasing system permease protein
MYKLFLCLRYLRSRVIAYFAVLGVALCVAMVLIVVSVMNGFLDKIEEAAKGLFGDVTVAATSLGGIAHYEEFITDLKGEVEAVDSATPFIVTVGILRVPGQDYRQTVQVVGIRLPPRTGRQSAGGVDDYIDVAGFAEGLHFQDGSARGVPAATFDPPRRMLLRRLQTELAAIEAMKHEKCEDALTVSSARTALAYGEEAAASIAGADETRRLIAVRERLLADLRAYKDAVGSLQDEIDDARRRGAPQGEIDALRRRLEALPAPAILREGEADLDARIAELEADLTRLRRGLYESPDRRVILGLGIPGLVHRTDDGRTIRKILPGNKVMLSLVPLGRGTVSQANVTTVGLTVIDDCRTDVYSIDSNFIYLPFEALQLLNDMDQPPRCSQILIKVDPAHARGERLLAVRDGVERAWARFRQSHPDLLDSGTTVTIETWRQRQAQVVGPLENQRTLAVIVWGIISLVGVLLIFVLFYMIVVQKTRDIGVLKAIGGSSGGVAQIFLAYGGAIGLVGSAIGTVGGYYFVRNINAVADAVDRWVGFRPWRKEVFFFEKIPNEVSARTAATIVIGAVIAGLFGALIPAIRAAKMQPVEALRYE